MLIDALATTAAQLETICRKYRTVQRLARASAEEVRTRRRVVRRELDDGMVRIEAVLLPDEAAAVMAAIEHEAKRVSAATFDRADGLMALAHAALRGEAPERAPVEIVMTVPAAALPASTEPVAPDHVGVFADGTCVSAETARRLACDAGVVELVEHDGGRPLSVGRRTRTLPASIKRAMLHRDQTCRFPGCTNRLYLDGHHIQHWADGGETSLGNVCSLCSLCRARHNEHYAAYRIMPRRPVCSDGDDELNAA